MLNDFKFYAQIMYMNTMECIKSRTSIRKYRKDSVPEKLILELIDAARHAPSSGNVQDWEFIAVTNTQTKEKLAEASYGQKFMREAPVVIAVCTDTEAISSAYGERGSNLYCVQNTAAAIQNMLLAANENGLGSCWVGAFSESDVKGILILPTKIRPLALITLGYPAESAKKKARREIKDILHKERW